MRIVLIGAVLFSRASLERLIALRAEVVGIVSRPPTPRHADQAPLDDLAASAGIPFHACTDINDETTVAWIAARRPDVIFCFGWSQIIRRPLLDLAPLGIVGYHPALLPKNRGRHPLIWALALGLEETGSTFFFMDEGADSGDILSQRRLPIRAEDDAGSLYRRMTETALEQLADFLPRLTGGCYAREPQDHGRASYWRRRSPADGRIDWRMPSAGVHNLVRALARPYPGATFRRGGDEVIVWRTEPIAEPVAANIEPGKVLAVEGRRLRVKTGDGAIDLVEHELDTLPAAGDYL